MTLRRFLNVISFIIAPTIEAQEDLKHQLDATSDKDAWGTSVNAQAGLEAMMGMQL